MSSAAVLVIGDEVLAGRTRDANTAFLGARLAELGIALVEARVVRDEQGAIVEAVNALRTRVDYLFTSGGIGPTHDDITCDSVAAAFGVPVREHPEALARLLDYYGPDDLNDARRRMARIPEGATLVDNPVSAAPGFSIGNVYVFAGVPKILQGMFDGIAHRLAGGAPILSETLVTARRESQLAPAMAEVQQRHAGLSVGSYPYVRDGRFGTRIVVSGRDRAAIQRALAELASAADALEQLDPL